MKQWLNNKVVPTFARMATQRHLLAIRNGIVQILPFVIAGSIAMILISFPTGSSTSDTLTKYMSDKVHTWLYYLYKWNFCILGLIAGLAVGSELAKSYRLNQTIGATLGAGALFMWIMPSLLKEGKMVNIVGSFDAGTMLGAVVGAMIAVEIYRLVVKYNITIKLPKSVPEQVTQAFIAIVPVVIMTTLFTAVRFLLGFDLRTFLTLTLQPVGDFISGNMGGAIIITSLISITWWFGVNLSGMLNGMVRPFWLQGLTLNNQIKEGKATGDYKIYVEQFNQSFTQAGGAGTALGMMIAILVFAKEKGNRSVGYVSIIPGIFNITEPLIFGYPIMLNPYFVVPFILTPIVITITMGLLSDAMNIHFIAAAPWTLPTPIFALLSTGMQWQAALLAIASIGISFGMYTPFVIMHDRAKIKEEQQKQEASAAKAAA